MNCFLVLWRTRRFAGQRIRFWVRNRRSKRCDENWYATAPNGSASTQQQQKVPRWVIGLCEYLSIYFLWRKEVVYIFPPLFDRLPRRTVSYFQFRRAYLVSARQVNGLARETVHVSQRNDPRHCTLRIWKKCPFFVCDTKEKCRKWVIRPLFFSGSEKLFSVAEGNSVYIYAEGLKRRTAITVAFQYVFICWNLWRTRIRMVFLSLFLNNNKITPKGWLCCSAR